MTTKRMALLLALLSSAAFANEARGQSSDSVPVGATLRVWSSELPRRPWIGVLQAERSDSLVLKFQKGNAIRSVSRLSIMRLDVQTARTRAQGARTFGLIGLAHGAATGAVLGALAGYLGGEYYPNGTDQPGVSPLVFSVPVGAAIGGAVWAIGGALFPGTRWRRLPVPLEIEIQPLFD